MFKKTLRRWIRNILHSDEATPTETVHLSSGSPFNKEFDGWNFRIHRASGGHIIEAWCYNPNPVHTNSYGKSVSGSSGHEHKLFIITSDEDLSVELPQILTQLALERS